MKGEARIFKKEFLLIAFATLLFHVSYQLLPTVLPVYMKGAGQSDEAVGLLMGIVAVAGVCIRPFTGSALDAVGRRSLLLIGLVMMALSSLLLACWPVVAMIFVTRLLLGFGWGISGTASSTVAADLVPRDRIAEGMGYYSLSMSLALALGPGVGLYLLNAIGIEVVGWVSFFFAAAAFLICMRIKIDEQRSQIISATIWGSLSVRNLFERTAFVPTIAAFLCLPAFGAVPPFVAIVANSRGIPGVEFYFALQACTTMISRPLFGKFVDKCGYPVGAMCGVIALLPMLAILAVASSAAELMLAALLNGLAAGCLFSTFQAETLSLAPDDRRGAANATYLVGFDLGFGLGSVVAGVVSAAVGYSSMFIIMTAFPLLSFAFYCFQRRAWCRHALSFLVRR